MTNSTPAKGAARPTLDLMGKRILASLADHVEIDAAGIARDLGATEQVVRARLGGMRDAGLVQGFNVRLDRRQLGESFEFLVSGAPTERTDRDAISGLCADRQVTRVFGLASAHSLAFTVLGTDLAATRAHALALAEQAGLRQPQVVMVLNTFQDRAGCALPSLVPEPAPVVRAAPLAAPVLATLTEAVTASVESQAVAA